MEQRRKKRGRPRTGRKKMVGVRLPKKLLKAVDKYAEKLFPYTRSAVICLAVENLVHPPHLRALAEDHRNVRTMDQLAADEARLEQGRGLEEAQAAIQAARLNVRNSR